MKIIGRFILLIFAGIPWIGFSQAPGLDRAKQKIYAAKTKEEKLANLVAFCKLRNSLHGDTIYRYASWAKQLAIELKDDRNLAWAEYSIISSDLAKGKTDSVIPKIEKSRVFDNIRKLDAALYYKIQLLKANALNRMDNRPAALELQLNLLNEAEKKGDINAQLFILNFIGATYLNVDGKAEEAKQAFLKGLQMIRDKPDHGNDEIEAYLLSNLALYYFNNYYVKRTKETSDSFFSTANHCIQLSEQYENLGVLASMLSLRANFYGLLQQFSAAEKDLQKSLTIRKKTADPYSFTDDLISLANFYLERKQYDKCIATAEEGFATAEAIRIKGLQIGLLGIMAKAYKSKGDFKQYSLVLERIGVLIDSSYRINSAEKIAAIQTKYEVQKKETLIAKQKLDLFRRNVLLYGSIVATMLLLLFLAYRFQRYRQQQKIRMATLMKEEKRQNEQAVKEAEEKERKRIAAELHDNLGVQANAILHNSTLLDKVNNQQAVNNLQETAKEMLLNLRETLWALKATDVAAADLWLRIINFMQQMSRHYTTIKFKIEGSAPPDMTIASNKALNIVLILQEAVNNAVKHAGAATITAESHGTENVWRISIKDDGKGFDINAIKEKKDNYGLQNMQERVAASAIALSITSEPGNGACITLEV